MENSSFTLGLALASISAVTALGAAPPDKGYLMSEGIGLGGKRAPFEAASMALNAGANFCCDIGGVGERGEVQRSPDSWLGAGV